MNIAGVKILKFIFIAQEKLLPPGAATHPKRTWFLHPKYLYIFVKKYLNENSPSLNADTLFSAFSLSKINAFSSIM